MNKVGILYICTGRYNIFWKKFYTSCEKYFLKDAEKHYFVFTDAEYIDFEKNNTRIKRIFQEKLPFPHSTLQRFNIFLKQEEWLSKMDYVVFFNANMVFKTRIDKEEFLPVENGLSLIAAIHAGFYHMDPDMFTYERNPLSTAFIAKGEGTYYVQGALQGGEASSFIKAMKVMDKNIQIDEQNKVMALWHDESHWNKYILNRTDVKYLSPSYLYPEFWVIPYKIKMLLLEKGVRYGHDYLRGISNKPKFSYVDFYYRHFKFIVKRTMQYFK